jgi:lipid A 3-O-deacylase
MPPRTLPSAAALALSALLAAGCGLHGARLGFREDNDVFNLGKGLTVDRDYTQGGVAALTLPDEDTPGWARSAAGAVPLFRKGAPVHLAWLFGQEIYTPSVLWKPFPIPDDRPYAAFAFAGIALQSPALDADPARRRDRLDHLELDVGVTGPSARGERTQNYVHQALGIRRAEGWHHQIGGRAAAILSWESRWRVLAGDLGRAWAWDLLPKARVRVGNVHDDLTVGAAARLGWNLPRDFGPLAVDSHGLTKGFPPPGPWFAIHAGLDSRLVAYDVFLEGDEGATTPEVRPRRTPIDTHAGLAVGWGPFGAAYVQHWLSPQFRERGRHHRYASLFGYWTWYF